MAKQQQHSPVEITPATTSLQKYQFIIEHFGQHEHLLDDKAKAMVVTQFAGFSCAPKRIRSYIEKNPRAQAYAGSRRVFFEN